MNGLLVMGQMEAPSMDPIREMLSDQGLIPIAVFQGSSRVAQESLAIFNHVSSEELMLFTRQFHTLFKAGMDMDTLLHTMAQQTKNKFFKDAILRIKSDVASGSSLSRAFGQHPKIFNELYLSMLNAGEEAGILEDVLGQLSTVIEKETALKSAVSSATLYPKIVIFVLIVAFCVLMTYVVPKFSVFFAHYDAELPLPTRMMMGMSDFMRNQWYILIFMVVAGIFAFRKWQSTAKGRFAWDRIKWKLPVFGPLGQKVGNARFAHILGALYKAGLPITRGLEITASTVGNEVFVREALGVKAEVEKGGSISQAMRQTKYFSPLLIEATAIGEKSGALDDMYKSVGSHYDLEVAHTLKNLTTLLEPILLFFVFGFIVLFALGIFLPMWGISRAVLHH
ncbi:type II secretion system F family protein [bacterium]|nr:type II secretion system F family protein [bacterium]